MKIEMWPISRPKPYASNPRINDDAVDVVAASIKEFGFRQPIVVDGEGVIVCGHTRFKAAGKLGLTKVPVHVAKDMTPEQIRAYRIADNRTNELATWDDDLLLKELDSISVEDPALSAMLDELRGDFSPEPTVTEDTVPEPPVDPVSLAGDLWLLGEHRLLCGDSTKADDVARLMAGHKPFIMVTDPPYGVEYDSVWRLEAGVNKPWQTLANGKVENDHRADWTESYDLFPGRVAYVWHAGVHSAEIAGNLSRAGLDIRTQIIWTKPSLVMGRGHYHWQHEPCWYAVRKGGSAKWCGDRKQSTVWQIANMHSTQGSVDDGKTIHSTQKPVECMARPIRNHGGKDDDVYDPFLGSGTTLIAAEQHDRRCFGIEIAPQYVDVILTRWANFTGREPVLESTGQAWSDMKTNGRRDG